MTKYLFLLGAGALVASAPAAAKPEGHGHGHHASEAKHGKHHSKYYAYGRNCPPGLAKKNNDCMPPGQLKRKYDRGQRYNLRYGSRWTYNQIPYDLRDRYDFSPHYRYYYGDGYLYQVDPKTLLIQQVVNAILR